MTREEAVRRIHRAAEENLTELDLSELGLEELSPEIGKCTQLETLLLGGKFDEQKREWVRNKLTEFPDAVLQLTNLKRLNLSRNQITAIPDALGQLSNLIVLDLSSNEITSIPETIRQLSNLTRLDLSSNEITSIPETIGQLSHLTRLDLDRNQITSIPEAIGQLSNLTQLSFWNNQIISIPEDLGQLSNLTLLNLSNNQITSIPEALSKLLNLTLLYLWNNQITSIPEALGKLSNLTLLYLWNNQITSIPEALGKLSNLILLDLSHNQITSIPEALGQLSNLRWLSLSSNQITSIPEVIGQLSNLTELSLGDNQITSIPEALGQLSNLTRLDLLSNQITEIPEAIRGMEKLEKLDLRGNPLPIPPEILQGENYHEPGDLRTILDFYFQTRNPNDTEELYEAKLLIVGEGESGKTTLANKLLNPDYELKEQEPSTEGIDVIRWEFQQANDKPFRVHIWDFGGQEIYHATHQFFLTERSFYILLVDNRRENPNLCYWLNIIELLSNSSPVFLVQNEKQDRRCEINVSQLRGDFENLEKLLTTNLADNRGLETLQRALQNRITTLDHISTPIPKHWANVRHVLENYAERKTHIEVSEFYDICANQGFDKSDKQAMLSLSKYLHDLGIILHFQTNADNKKSLLFHWVILRPEWATNAVYKVTDNQQVIANCGYFTDENLSEIWIDRQYQGLHDELLQLMENFKICYSIPGQRGHYIAPQRLPLEAPKYDDWDDTDNLIVCYKYQFMPKGIITRLIVEMHGWICRPNIDPCSGAARRDIVWRDGVLLAEKYAKAEVIENYHQGEIRIRVSGTQKNYLLNSIRYQLWKIHDTYDKRLKYQEFIPCNCSECKGSQDPHSYTFESLRRRLNNRRYEVECEKSYQMVNVRGLMEDFPDNLQQWEEKERISGIDRPDFGDSSSIQFNINVNGKKVTQDSSKTNHFTGPMSGVIGSDNATVSNNAFIQNNNANTAELLQLISSMRETASQFPEDVRDGIILDIEAVEAEIKKPEKERENTRLKTILKRILAAGTAIGIGVVGVTEFANTAIDVGQKLGIELKLPSAR
jgi:internalin A